jgi:hypothetical protein
MPEEPPLRPATTEELLHALAFALRFQGRKRVHDTGDLIAQIVAERLARHLEKSGFVVMKKPPRPAHSVRYDTSGKLRET